MARDWRRLALAALAAAAVALSGALGVHAQSAPKAGKSAPTAKKAPDKAPAKDGDDEEEEELKPKAAAKAKKQDPAEAQRAVEAAGKMLETGKADQAAQSMATVLAGGNLPPAIMAKAFLYRGMAYRQQQKSVQAISDLTSALWLKGGLSQADRTIALQQRSAAYAEAGLTESGQPLAAAFQTGTTKERPASSSSAGSWGAATTDTASNSTAGSETTAAQSGGSGSGWSLFGGLFGGGSSAQANPSAQTQTQTQQTVPSFTTTTTTTTTTSATATSAKAAPEAKSSSWASGTEVRSEQRAIETSALRAKPEGRFRVQVAMVRSQDEAEAVAAKVKRDYAMALAAREPEIDQAVVGNMGSFYRVRVGPFATQNEGQAACTKLKGSGLDCQVVMP